MVEYRQKRRAIRESNPQAYAQLIIECSEKLDQVMDTEVIALLGELNIDMGVYQRNCEMQA